MTHETNLLKGAPSSSAAGLRTRAVHASRAPRPRACGCGLPVAFDPEKQEFFCIGCGSATLCLCARSILGSRGRPVNVV